MKIMLAPMEGVVDHHLRYLLSKLGGIDLCVTEFIRVTSTALPEKVFKRYSPELPRRHKESNAGSPKSPSEFGAICPTRIQLLGSDPETLATNARKAARLGAPGIDLNFGCPAKTVNKNRGGACLLKETETLFTIVKAVRQAVPQHIPVTAKIRLGFEARDNYLENALAIQEAGASELVVHARSKADGYHPPAYWECIGEISDALHINVIANGEIWSVEDYRRCVEQSRCRDVMLGRGLLAKPDLALAIKAYQRGDDWSPLPWPDIAMVLLDFFDITTACYPAKFLGNRTKQWLFYLQREYPEAQSLFNQIKRSRDFATLRQAVLAQCTRENIAEKSAIAV